MGQGEEVHKLLIPAHSIFLFYISNSSRIINMADKDKKKSRITFKQTSDTEVKVFLDGKQVGNFWSQDDGGTFPYPHDESSDCSVQICGFDNISATWGCGIYQGTKDCVVGFLPKEDPNYIRYAEEYQQYIRGHFKIVHEAPEGYKGFIIPPKIAMRDGKDVRKILPFNEWLQTLAGISRD
jgi:hypothetical protein